LSHYEAALRLRPDDARAHYNVGYALLASGRRSEARQQFERALQLQPDFAAARDMLRRLQDVDPLAP
jgi:protein O-mannosyl-transferase